MCVANQNHKKFAITPILGNSRSFKVIDVDITKKLVAGLVTISSMSVPICNHFYARELA